MIGDDPSTNMMMASAKMEELFEWRKWSLEIPYIEWPQGWKVKAIPPFAAAVIRYWILVPGNENQVSVYLDCYDSLGHFGSPYWEVYPFRGDTGRCEMADVKTLLEMIGDRADGAVTPPDNLGG